MAEKFSAVGFYLNWVEGGCLIEELEGLFFFRLKELLELADDSGQQGKLAVELEEKASDPWEFLSLVNLGQFSSRRAGLLRKVFTGFCQEGDTYSRLTFLESGNWPSELLEEAVDLMVSSLDEMDWNQVARLLKVAPEDRKREIRERLELLAANLGQEEKACLVVHYLQDGEPLKQRLLDEFMAITDLHFWVSAALEHWNWIGELGERVLPAIDVPFETLYKEVVELICRRGVSYYSGPLPILVRRILQAPELTLEHIFGLGLDKISDVVGEAKLFSIALVLAETPADCVRIENSFPLNEARRRLLLARGLRLIQQEKAAEAAQGQE